MSSGSDETPGRHFDMSNCIPEINKHFNIFKKIGEGTFSTVFKAKVKSSSFADPIAIKYILPTCSITRTENEFLCLQKYGGTDNVIGLLFGVRHEGYIALGMPYFPHDKFHTYVDNLNIDEIRDYMKNLFTALAHIHSHNIIHRDVKPSNFLYNRKLKKYALVDFGLSQRVKHKPSSPTKSHEIKNNRNDQKRKIHEINEENKCDTLSPMKKRIALGQLNFNGCSDRPVQSKCDKKDNDETLPQPPKNIGFTRLDLSLTQSSVDTPSNFKISSLDKSTRVQATKSNLGNKITNSIKGNGINLLLNHSTKHSKISRQINKCRCYGKAQVCQICLKWKPQCASRAGTAGYRAPEVLLKHPNQTTAIDMWSAGVIFLTFLSGYHPFFSSTDDMTCLGDIITVFGTNAVKESAIKIGKMVTSKPTKPPLDIKKICIRLRQSSNNEHSEKPSVFVDKCPQCNFKIEDNDCVCLKSENSPKCASESSFIASVPDEAFNLLHQLLCLDPNARITASTALKHPFITGNRCDESDFFSVPG